MINAEDILEFWFVKSSPKDWFNGGPAFDAKVRKRFEDFSVDLAARLRTDFAHPWAQSANGSLALNIALDQFPRNMFRGTTGMFAFDDLALRLAKDAVRKGYDLQIPQARRSFIYMPFMHSENMADQDECVSLMETRMDNESNVFHAKAHRKLIARFGRFPHRNEVLGRQSTQEELDFLASGGYQP